MLRWTIIRPPHRLKLKIVGEVEVEQEVQQEVRVQGEEEQTPKSFRELENWKRVSREAGERVWPAPVLFDFRMFFEAEKQKWFKSISKFKEFHKTNKEEKREKTCSTKERKTIEHVSIVWENRWSRNMFYRWQKIHKQEKSKLSVKAKNMFENKKVQKIHKLTCKKKKCK